MLNLLCAVYQMLHVLSQYKFLHQYWHDTLKRRSLFDSVDLASKYMFIVYQRSVKQV